MKNDFDFIKEKIENSGVNAPEKLDGSYALGQIEGREPAPYIAEVKPKKPRYGLITGLAAAFVAVVALSVFGIIKLAGRNVSSDTVRYLSADIPLRTFSSYDELGELVSQTNKKNMSSLLYEGLGLGGLDSAVDEKDYDSITAGSWDDSDYYYSGTGGTGASGESYSETYKQVEGVDEAEIVKTDGKYLYIVSLAEHESVQIFTADDKPKKVAEIFPESGETTSATPDEEGVDDYTYFSVDEMYLHDGKLIVICNTMDAQEREIASAIVYDVSDIKNIRLVDRFTQSGCANNSRMIGDRLYLVSSHTMTVTFDKKLDTPVCYRGEKEREIPIDRVYAVDEPSTVDWMMIIGGYDLKNSSEDVQSTALLGTVEDVYCSGDNLYVYAAKWNFDTSFYGAYAFGATDSEDDPEALKTAIYKVSLTDGISFTAYAEIEGRLDSRYSLDEKDGYLRVAATTEDQDYRETNSLYVLDSELKEVGSVTGFAPDESIRAVRYVGDTAYVITYEQTDPLFVIDVSDPRNPTILGEVKIDGFSTMLVPIDDNTVLGLGYSDDLDGFKLALFDVSDRMDPKVVDEKIYDKCNSPVMYEPRALVYHPDRGDFLIPLNYEEISNDYYEVDVRGGMLNFKVENGKIVENSREEFKFGDNENYLYVERCAYVGENIYMIVQDYDEGVRLYTTQYR